MKILIVDDNPAFTRICSDTIRYRFPGARIDVVVSVGGYFNDHWDTPYDVCIMSDKLYAGRSAFRGMAPAIRKKFPDAGILCNSDLRDMGEAEKAEKLAGTQLFARGQDGNIIPFGRDVCALMGYMRTMVLPKSERMGIAPVRVSVAPIAEHTRAEPGQTSSGNGGVRRMSERPGKPGAERPSDSPQQPLMLRSNK